VVVEGKEILNSGQPLKVTEMRPPVRNGPAELSPSGKVAGESESSSKN